MRRYGLKSSLDLGAFTLVLFTSANDIFIIRKEKEAKKKTHQETKRGQVSGRGEFMNSSMITLNRPDLDLIMFKFPTYITVAGRCFSCGKVG